MSIERFAALSLLLMLPPKPLPPTGPAKGPHPDYPVHVRLIVAKGGQKAIGFQGFGRGEILGDQPQSFRFTYTCEAQLPASDGAEDFYQARWKTQDLKLDVLTQRPGSKAVDHCELDVAIAH